MSNNPIFIRIIKTRSGATAHVIKKEAHLNDICKVRMLAHAMDVLEGKITLHITYHATLSPDEIQSALAFWWSRGMPIWDIGGPQRIILAPIDVETAAGQGDNRPAAELVKHSLMS